MRPPFEVVVNDHWGCHILTPKKPKLTRIHSQTANRAGGTGFRDITVSQRNFCQTIDLIARIARNQARELDHWIADSNRVIGVLWINQNPKGLGKLDCLRFPQRSVRIADVVLIGRHQATSCNNESLIRIVRLAFVALSQLN